jgi:CDP-2,3-bis-(O-geranylgeranyl)-sn-glycerol synthase
MIDLGLETILIVVFYAIPMYFANATPIIFHGKFPIDFGKKIGQQRIFGKGKTWVGFFSGVLGGLIAGSFFATIFPGIFKLIPNYFELIVLLSIGALFGDLVESFFKRRLGFESGELWLLADQLDFVVGGFLLSMLIRFPELEVVVIILIVTVFAHMATNFAAYKMKLKKVPW